MKSKEIDAPKSELNSLKSLGYAIKIARKKAGLTQKALGEKCEIAEPTIRKYELGVLNPKIETISKISSALGVSMFELMLGTNKWIEEIPTSVLLKELQRRCENGSGKEL